MASNSAGNVLREILGRTGDLSTAIDQHGSSLSIGTAPQTTTSVESEVRNLFGAVHQARSSNASASSPAISASQNGPLYTEEELHKFPDSQLPFFSGRKKKGCDSFRFHLNLMWYSYRVPMTKTFHAKVTDFSFKKVDMSLWHYNLRKSGVIWK